VCNAGFEACPSCNLLTKEMGLGLPMRGRVGKEWRIVCHRCKVWYSSGCAHKLRLASSLCARRG
jgi:hypothetical protein